MKAIDRLSDAQVLALARFIAGCAQQGSLHWRTKFNECARTNYFWPYVTGEDHEHLRSIAREHDRMKVCGLQTRQIVEAANQVATEWGQPLVNINVSSAVTAAVSS
ncbi:MAG: hypothetical protein SXG53_26640 [Pseudomonadota bacterium]|nr:hypothetical protein [Pseudomonadota bacterium]